MKKRNMFLVILLIVIITVVMVLSIINISHNKHPYNVFMVYLSGKKIGAIIDDKALYDLIDKEQEKIKEKYDVEKVYPPTNLEVTNYVTYDEEVADVKEIYDYIKNLEPFTIKGYQVTIKSNEEGKENFTVAVKNRETIEYALNSYASSIIGKKDFENYMNDTQEEIVDVGEIIETVYFKETISIKDTFISTGSKIYTDVSDLTHLLLFGTDTQTSYYTVKEGDSLNKIAEDNKLNVEELLIANPSLKSENTILSPGQQLNVSLINPVLNLVYNKHIVNDEEIAFQTEVVYDEEKAVTYSAVTRDGETGISRITKKVQYVNGEPNEGSFSIGTTEIKPAVNKIITKGKKAVYGFTSSWDSNDVWYWPTNIPYIISSERGYRWGSMHEGIDITGTGHGSPIYAASSGEVVKVGDAGSYGNAVVIDHKNGYFTRYAHLNEYYVKVGQMVKYGEVIGTMGNTGRSTGTHLHFEVWVGNYYNTAGGYTIEPRSLYR